MINYLIEYSSVGESNNCMLHKKLYKLLMSDGSDECKGAGLSSTTPPQLKANRHWVNGALHLQSVNATFCHWNSLRVAYMTALNFEVWAKPTLLKNKCSFHTRFPLWFSTTSLTATAFSIITVIAMHSFLFASVHLAAMAQCWQIGKNNSGMQMHLFSIPETIRERAICCADTVLLEQQLLWLRVRPRTGQTGCSHALMLLPCFGRLFFYFYLSTSANLILMQLTWYSTLSKDHFYNEISVWKLYLKQTDALENTILLKYKRNTHWDQKW